MLTRVAEALARADKGEEAQQAATAALDVARKIEDADSRSWALARVAEALAKADETAQALDAAGRIEDANSRSRALVSVVEALARDNETLSEARSAIEVARRAAEQITREDIKSAALANVATGLAKLHFYRQARELVDNNNTSAADKFTAYTAILREYYIERHRDQANLFEEEKQKED